MTRRLWVVLALMAAPVLARSQGAAVPAPLPDPRQAGVISPEQIQKEGKSADERAALNLKTAGDTALEAMTTAVASELRCPVCQGLSLQASPSELAQQMRGLVKDQLAAGKTPDEVKAYFVSKYGEWILLSPKPRGFNLLVYVLPLVLVGSGITFIWVMVRKWSRPELTDADRTPSGPA
ncbi:MAG: cytochrome c-type biogenesis protein CcmH [Gemmatimonadetes bacterium]|nr:cytochrome c-type biogenesis protein CcmH [Gemmatimonadota bacterium]